MSSLSSRLLRLFNKSAAPRPWDLSAAVRLEELARGRTDLALELGRSLEDPEAGGILDSAALATLVRLRAPRSVFEIGTGFGRSTTLFALNSAGAEIFTLSLPGNADTGRVFRGRDWATRIRQLEGDSTTFDYAAWRGRMDFVLVDGCHESPVVEQDTAHAFELVSPTGWIAWHDVDADAPDVIRCLCRVPRPGIMWVTGTRYALWRAS